MRNDHHGLARLRTRWSAVGAAVAITLGAGGIGFVQASTPASTDVTVTIAPERILDTRINLGLSGPFAPNAPRDVQVTGEVDVATASDTTTKTVVPPGAAAVLVNVTVTEPTDVGFLTLRPAGASGLPATSTVNFGAGSTEPNAATVALSGDGKLQVWVFMPTASATAHVLIDVVGYTIGHDHDDRYYTETEVDTKLAAKADASDVYTKSQVDTALSDKADASDVYTKSQVDTALSDKANAADVFTQLEVENLVESLWTVTVAGAAFVPGSASDAVSRSFAGGGSCAVNTSSAGYMGASVQVPVGYRVTALNASFFDVDAGGDATLTVWHGSSFNTPVANVSSSGSGGFQQAVVGTVTANNTVNPGEWMWIEFKPSAANTQGICGVELTLARS